MHSERVKKNKQKKKKNRIRLLNIKLTLQSTNLKCLGPAAAAHSTISGFGSMGFSVFLFCFPACLIIHLRRNFLLDRGFLVVQLVSGRRWQVRAREGLGEKRNKEKEGNKKTKGKKTKEKGRKETRKNEWKERGRRKEDEEKKRR